ncbi:hypothetical protein BJ138DRAFT_1117446 [Hygrophoropsis aurantiaca]|uniref:Uncharacterized protein n=1 Tax=Hygrophoropsis aurantiaca TaxID=72124 RepID=A0ACB8A1K0_9AGAM|nr:hypothetical protein BJ138DRAFT_1117446 [Hygrophoropsis aurantiaca]
MDSYPFLDEFARMIAVQYNAVVSINAVVQGDLTHNQLVFRTGQSGHIFNGVRGSWPSYDPSTYASVRNSMIAFAGECFRTGDPVNNPSAGAATSSISSTDQPLENQEDNTIILDPNHDATAPHVNDVDQVEDASALAVEDIVGQVEHENGPAEQDIENEAPVVVESKGMKEIVTGGRFIDGISVDDCPTKQFKLYRKLRGFAYLGKAWLNCVQSFINFERFHGFSDDRHYISTRHRPDEIALWQKKHRCDIGMFILPSRRASFVTDWWRWWRRVYPNEGTRVIKPGPNGIILVVLSLAWLGRSTRNLDDNDVTKSSWREAVLSVTQALTDGIA